MAALIDAINIKRKMFFEFENTPFHCLEAEVSTPTARGAQTLVRLKMRNLLTRAVFEKTFKASDKFKEPDLEMVPASFLYSDGEGFYFMDQESFETLALSAEMIGDARDFLAHQIGLRRGGLPVVLEHQPPHSAALGQLGQVDRINRAGRAVRIRMRVHVDGACERLRV